MTKKQINTDVVTETELIRYFNSGLDSDERERIEAWIARSEKNKALAHDVYTAFLANDVLETIFGLAII